MRQFIIVVTFIAATLLGACGTKEPAKEDSKFHVSDTLSKMIRIDTVKMCNIDDQISLSGEISFNENNVVKIYPRSSGQVIETKVSLGDKVTKGQVVAIIKSADIAGNVSDLSSANADLAIAKRALENTESLYKSGIASEREYTEAKQNYEKALAAKNKVQSLLNINSGGGKTNQGGQYALTSPIDGYIVEKKITAGSYIRTDMGDNLFTISDLKNIWVYANVYEVDIPKVREGYQVKVISMTYPDKIFYGKIDKVSQVLDPQSKAMKVRVTLENTDMLLKPDMFASVIVSHEESEKAICIPASAPLSLNSKDYVVVYHNNDSVRIAEVNILKTVNDRTYLRSGVQPGEMVITKNQNLILAELQKH